MSIFTKSFELTTALTNFLIFIVSVFCVIKIKEKNWKTFYILITIDSFLGTIVHGIVISDTIKTIIWSILAISFVLTVNSLLLIFTNIKTRYPIYLSIIISILLLIQYFLNMRFLLTFTFYSLIIIIITFIYMIKSSLNNKKYFILGYVFQIIGGVFLLSRVQFNYFNFNGICHLFMLLTLIFFYIGIKKNNLVNI